VISQCLIYSLCDLVGYRTYARYFRNIFPGEERSGEAGWVAALLRIHAGIESVCGVIERTHRQLRLPTTSGDPRADSGKQSTTISNGDYKLAWAGGWLIAVPPQNTSRTCPACGHVWADNRPTQTRFACVECGYEENADVVGAINILARGHRVAACGELVQSGRSAKQEPTYKRLRSSPRSAVGIPSLSTDRRRPMAEEGEDVKVPTAPPRRRSA
jgi:predicted RNA-binding Zn-ribbon protein involved in translation (DUF1610 family)